MGNKRSPKSTCMHLFPLDAKYLLTDDSAKLNY